MRRLNRQGVPISIMECLWGYLLLKDIFKLFFGTWRLAFLGLLFRSNTYPTHCRLPPRGG